MIDNKVERREIKKGGGRDQKTSAVRQKSVQIAAQFVLANRYLSSHLAVVEFSAPLSAERNLLALCSPSLNICFRFRMFSFGIILPLM